MSIRSQNVSQWSELSIEQKLCNTSYLSQTLYPLSHTNFRYLERSIKLEQNIHYYWHSPYWSTNAINKSNMKSSNKTVDLQKLAEKKTT